MANLLKGIEANITGGELTFSPSLTGWLPGDLETAGAEDRILSYFRDPWPVVGSTPVSPRTLSVWTGNYGDPLGPGNKDNHCF